MLRKKLLKFLILAFCILLPWHYAKNNGYIVKLQDFIDSEIGDFVAIKEIQISGNYILSEEEVLKITDIEKGDRIYHIYAQQIRDRLLARREIKNASVRVNYSGLVKIVVDERKPFAIWWHNNVLWLVDEDGDEILQIDDKERYNSLIVIFGQNIKEKLKIFLDIMMPHPLYKEVMSIHYIGNRRWDVYLNNNIIVKLPEKDAGSALINAEKILKNPKYQDRIDMIDLRLHPKRVFLKLKEKV